MARRRAQHSIIDDVSARLAQAYAAERKDWHRNHGRKVGDLPVEPDVWRRMAAFLLENKIADYMAFIHLQFETLGSGGTCPPPRQCFGPAALARWQTDLNRTEALRKDAICAFDFQRRHAQGQLAEAQAIAGEMGWSSDERDRFVMLDESNQLSPLFRYCMALATNHPAVAETYANEATVEYLLARELYDYVWRDFIPEQLRQAASQYTLSGFLG